jgi:hypothetical protein
MGRSWAAARCSEATLRVTQLKPESQVSEVTVIRLTVTQAGHTDSEAAAAAAVAVCRAGAGAGDRDTWDSPGFT